MSCILAEEAAVSYPLSALVRAHAWNYEPLQSRTMPRAQSPALFLRLLLVPVRVLLVSFLLALLSFALFLFLGIVGLLVSAVLRGAPPNMTVAYREIAFPGALVAAGIALLVAIVIEVRYQSRKRIESRLM